MVKAEQFIHIKSPKFPILPGEEEELVNEGMFGKALAIYLQEQLGAAGYDVPWYNCEDWGWWVKINGVPFMLGACIHCGPGIDGGLEYACIVGVPGRRVWSWKKFRFIDTTPWADKLFDDMLSIFNRDPEVEVIGVTDVCPVGSLEFEDE